MIQKISTLALLSCLFFTACQKSSVSPDTAPSQPAQKTTIPTTGFTHGVATDTVSFAPVTGYIRLQFAMDSINTDNILINFNPTAKTKYVPGEDAPSMQGFGLVSMSSLSSDNVPLAINAAPLTKKGLCIALNVNARADGIYKINMTAAESIPNTYSIYIKDNYKKDSLDLRLYSSYAFNIFKADTSSLGRNRFKLMVRPK